MVATAPSPTTEWGLRRPRAGDLRLRRLADPTRAHWPLAALDLGVGVGAALLLEPLGSPADLALGGLWFLLLRPARRAAGEPVRTAVPARAALGAGLVLAFISLVLCGAASAGPDPALLTAFTCLVTSAAWASRAALGAVHERTRTHRVRAVVAGHGHGVDRMLRQLRAEGGPVEVVAVCLTGRSQDRYDLPVVRGLGHLTAAVTEHRADTVVVAPCRHLDPVRLRRISWGLEEQGTRLLVGTGLPDIGPGRTRIGLAGSVPLIHVQHAALSGSARAVKQSWERLAAAVALLALAPLLLGLALLVRLDSPGPALFRQTRVGRDGRAFTMLKLRTMCQDAEARREALVGDGPPGSVLFKTRSDPRVTRVGRVLRRYSLDELPQLLNVVRGEMSLVGPRPPLPSEVAQYDRDTVRRLAVTPGLTGLWQVSGRSDLTWEQSVRLDIRYVENWSLGLDLRILLRTARAVLAQDGAY